MAQRGPASLAAQLLRRGATGAAHRGGVSGLSPARFASSGAAPGAASTPFDAARAAHELELAKLRLAEQAAASEAADRAAKLRLAEQVTAAELLRLQQGRGAWEALFGLKRETAQLLNLGGGAVVFLTSVVYLTSGMVHDALATIRISDARSEDATHVVRSLLSNAQRAPAEPPQLRVAPAAWRGRFVSLKRLPAPAPANCVAVPQPPPPPPPPRRS